LESKEDLWYYSKLPVQKLAAEYIGRDEDTIIRWKKSDKKFADQVASAKDVLSAISKHTKANINYQDLGMNIFELAQKGRQIYEDMVLQEEKRELLNFIFSNLKLRDEKLIPSLHNGFEVIASRAKDGNWLRDSV
jgi:hypothetical protein